MTDVDDNDIAIVGMALRVPGASTPEEFWANLIGGVESTRSFTEEELLAKGVSASTLADPKYVRKGMVLQDMDQFDPEFFGFSPKEAAILDPQHRQFYEVAWESLERAGHPPSRFKGNIGLFAGCGMGSYFIYNLLTNPELIESVGVFLLRHTGNDKDFLATRVSYSFNLKGPSVNVQTACSTSLVATHLAVQSLLSRECDMALAGGVTIEIPHGVGYHYKEGEVLSPDGHCRTFDHRAKGTVFGSGAGVVVLRRLADALADGDHIHAVIKASAVNNDGSSKVGYLAPSVDGQAAAIAEAIAVSGVSADSIGYVECHGTATPVGDPIEIAALTQAFRESTDRAEYCYVGSVKPNIGHLDTAAGVASLIKASLAVEHGKIPPSLNFEAPNPTIAFDGGPFKVAAALTPWPESQTPRRAAVNSLGVGGTNAFVVLQQPPLTKGSSPDPNPQPLVLSARNRRALDDASQRLATWLRENRDVPLADVASTLMLGRHAFDQRRVLACSTHDEAATLLENNEARRVFTHTRDIEKPSIVFMFPGGGAQYFEMARGLYEREPVFREQMDRGLGVLRDRFKTDLTSVFLPEPDAREITTEKLSQTAVQLPLIFLIEFALTRLWEHYGITPVAMIGHSLGENTAACIAGVFSFEDALGLVLLRGQLVDEVPEGAMLSVSMPGAELAALMGPDLDLASANSPQLSVASGTPHLIDALEARLKREGIDCQRVRLKVAAHSRLFDVILGRFRAYLQSIKLGEPKIPIVSNRTGKWLTAAQARDPDYWVGHLRHSVLFGDGVETLLETPERVFLEVGPGNILSSFVRQNPKASAQRVFSSLRHPDDTVSDAVYFRTIVGRLWAVGAPIKTERLWPTPRARVPMPTYPFQHSSYWIAPGSGAALPAVSDVRPMRLPSLDGWFRVPRWIQQGILEKSDTPCTWLVFQGNEPVADALVGRLRDRGHRVVTVTSGDTFTRLDETSFMIAPEAGGVGYGELVEALADSNLLPDRVLHTWLITWDQSFRPGSTFFHRNQEYGFYSLFHLARALGKASAVDRPIHLIVAGNGVLRVSDEPAQYPDKATALGPCAVIPREFPNITCEFIDVAIGKTVPRGRKSVFERNPSIAIEALAEEIDAVAANGVVAWRDGVRWQRHLGKWTANADPGKEIKLRREGVYLLTGGMGGIAGVVAEWLARQYRAKLVLVGRTPLPRREDWDEWVSENGSSDGISRSIQRIRHLEALGSKVLILTADVTVADQMRAVVADVRATFGEVNGVFHTAGVIRDNLIQLKSQRDIEEVFSAKVYGTVVLDQVFQSSPLDFMLLFSSTSSFVAPQGQVDYVGANSFLNAFADSCRGGRPFPVIALNWGVWKGVGMVGSAGSNDAMEREVDRSHAADIATQHPLFQKHYSSRDGLSTVHWLTGTLSAERDWVIFDHRLANGDALLPGTGYLELIRATMAEIGTSTWQVHNLLFENPLFVRDGQPRDFRIRLRGDEHRWDIEVLARRLGSAIPDDDWEKCASARVLSGAVSGIGTIPLQQIEGRCSGKSLVAGGSSSLRIRQEDHLQFGPRWRVLKRLSLGDGEALARLQLPPSFADDLSHFGLHPGLLDIATGCAMDLIPGYVDQEVAQNLWAPILYRTFRFYSSLPAELVSWVKLSAESQPAAGFASFDIVLTDHDGRVVAEVEQLTLRRLDRALMKPATDPIPAVTAEGAPARDKTKALTPGELALQHNVSQGIDAEGGVAALNRLLAAGGLPSTLIVSSMDVAALIRQADSISKAPTVNADARFSRPELDSNFEPPRDEVERKLAELWGKLLGVQGVGIRDSFFDLGGHSLIAVRLFNEIGDKFEVDLPMSVLLQQPTIAGLADLIRAESPNAQPAPDTATADQDAGVPPKPGSFKYRHLVPMHSGPVADRSPLFIVAGMFGNVLNLSHLAHLLGEDRPFYALQARGLFGELEPHERFEDMARDYIAEVRLVQPHGPYTLGGFSGGGITAYEMARQLIEQGEEVSQVILLDTPVPRVHHLSRFDRLSMFWQGLRRGGVPFLRKKFRERVQWEKQQYLSRRENQKYDDGGKAQFQSRRIGDAFVRAVRAYETKPVPVRVTLFRPKLDVQYRLSGGRLVDSQRNYLYEDNGWTPFAKSVEIHEVPGNHDSMVLEPNVRVLVNLMRKSIRSTESSSKADAQQNTPRSARRNAEVSEPVS